MLWATRISCLEMLTSRSVSTHRDVSAKVARQVQESTSRAGHYMNDAGSDRGTDAWRCLRADVARRKRACDRLGQRIAAVEADLKRGEF